MYIDSGPKCLQNCFKSTLGWKDQPWHEFNLFILLFSECTVSYLLFFKPPIPPPLSSFPALISCFPKKWEWSGKNFHRPPHHHYHSHPLVSVPIFSHLLPVTMNEKSQALNPCGLYTRSHPFSSSKIETSSSLQRRRSHPLSWSIPSHINYDHWGGSSYWLSWILTVAS